jgi:hypothetical protein
MTIAPTLRARKWTTSPMDANTCDSVHWYEGDLCVLGAGHMGEHRDAYGLTWDTGAGPESKMRLHGPWLEVCSGVGAA